MTDPNDKLDLDAISFDDMLGDGLELEDINDDSNEDLTEDSDDVETVDEDLNEDLEDDIENDENEDPVDDVDPDAGDEDEDEGLENDPPRSVASEIADTLGYELEEEYDDSVEGLTKFAKDIANNVAEEQLNSLFEQYPDVQKHLDYVMNGGDSSKFFEAYNPNSDYSNFELSEKDTSMQRAVLGQYFQLKGMEDEFINEMLDDYEDSGKLFTQASRAKDALANAQAAQRENMLQQQAEAKRQADAETAQFWDSVATTIESGNEFAGIKIPDRQKSKFFDYISKPVGRNGETQRDIDYSEAEMEVKLAIDYLMYNGFKLDDIINTKARTKSARNLRDRIQSNKEKVKSARGSSRRVTDFDPDDLDMNALL